MSRLCICLVFVSLSNATFSTLEPGMFPQGTSLFSLVRNLGSSIGISAVQTMLVRNTATAHAGLVADAHLAQWPALQGGAVPDLAQLAVLNGEIDRQSQMIGYLDDFRLLTAVTLAVIPMLLLIQQGKARGPGGPVGD